MLLLMHEFFLKRLSVLGGPQGVALRHSRKNVVNTFLDAMARRRAAKKQYYWAMDRRQWLLRR